MVYSDTRLTSTLSAPAVDFLLTPSSPYYAATNAAYGAPGSTSPILAFWRATDAGQRDELYRTKALNASIGVKGSMGDWDYEASFTHSQNTWTQSYGGGYMTNDGVARFVEDGSVDPFALAGQQSAAATADINSAKVSGQVREGLSKLDFIEAHGSHPLFSLAGGDATLGFGADARRIRQLLARRTRAGNAIRRRRRRQSGRSLQRSAHGPWCLRRVEPAVAQVARVHSRSSIRPLQRLRQRIHWQDVVPLHARAGIAFPRVGGNRLSCAIAGANGRCPTVLGSHRRFVQLSIRIDRSLGGGLPIASGAIQPVRGGKSGPASGEIRPDEPRIPFRARQACDRRHRRLEREPARYARVAQRDRDLRGSREVPQPVLRL